MRSAIFSLGLLGVLASTALPACSFDPHPQDGVMPCSVGCPSGYVCAADDTCWTPAEMAPSTLPPSGPMVVGRGHHTATLLQSGSVLIAGGTTTIGTISDAELYDPTTGTFLRTGSMTTARANHTATLLNGGLVLITGGRGQNNAEQSAELYDPATGTFTPTGSMAWVRESHTATLLPSGQVLVVTGTGECDAQLYDPNIGTFSPAGSLDDCRGMQTATLLANGKVLIAGGITKNGTFLETKLRGPTTFPQRSNCIIRPPVSLLSPAR